MRKILQSDWLDCAMWTIYTFPYRRSGPFIRHLITIKTRVFRELGNKVLAEGREMLDMLGKLSANFQKNLTRLIVTFLAEYSINFHKIFMIHPNNVPNILVRQ